MKLFINSKIFKILKTSSSIVGKKKTMFLLTLTLFINVFFEALSIASIIPFINAMVSPNFYETVSNYTLFNFKFDYFLGYLNINNEKELRIFLSLIFLFFFLIKNFFQFIYNLVVSEI